MNKKVSKKMRGFMCQSVEVTASCMTPDCRQSVILSRRSTDRNLVDHARLLSNTKYIRLAERRGFVVPVSRRPSSGIISSSVGRDRHDCVKLDQNALPNQVFQREVQGKTSKKRKTEEHSGGPPSGRYAQVVVMRVSIHCQGCAGKVKKHLSKMEGVTSFSVDLESKRVTVMGHVSPVAVLESISKVKKAEFWPR